MLNRKVVSNTATFGERLKELRKEAGIKQKELAAMLGIGEVTINRWEKGTQVPKTEVAYELYAFLAGLFDVPLLYLTGNSDARKSNDYGSDEDAAREAQAREINSHYQILRMFLSLSPEMKEVVSATLVKAYHIDKERSALVSWYDEAKEDNSTGSDMKN